MHRSASEWSGTGSVGFEAGGHLLGLVSVTASGVPASAFLAGERVEAVIGDDVEAVVALDDVCHRRSLTTSAPTRRACQRCDLRRCPQYRRCPDRWSGRWEGMIARLLGSGRCYS